MVCHLLKLIFFFLMMNIYSSGWNLIFLTLKWVVTVAQRCVSTGTIA